VVFLEPDFIDHVFMDQFVNHTCRHELFNVARVENGSTLAHNIISNLVVVKSFLVVQPEVVYLAEELILLIIHSLALGADLEHLRIYFKT
jgi:hypothetical protein